jgi:hypothetical protein
MANDASISGLTVGKGGGAVATNTALGNTALAANTTASNNTAIGHQAAYSNQTGTDIVAVGKSALYANTGSSNTGVGSLSLRFNTTGSSNTGVGYLSMFSNTTGANNVAVGRTALEQNTTGGTNTAVGAQALALNTTASNNTAVGYQAGYNTTTSANNVFIGYTAGIYVTSRSNTAVGTGSCGSISTCSGIGNSVFGEGAGASLTTGEFNTFIGSAGQVNQGSGGLITTGSNNSILGTYNGNQGGLDIRAASNYVVLSGGGGIPQVSSALNFTVALQGAVPNSGTGITFPASQSASSNANTLDDYEEGTWTPNQGSGLVVVGDFSSSGNYTKIGNLVYIAGQVDSTTTVACNATGTITSNLPFTVGALLSLGGAVNATQTSAVVTYCTGTRMDSPNSIGAATTIFFSAVYRV